VGQRSEVLPFGLSVLVPFRQQVQLPWFSCGLFLGVASVALCSLALLPFALFSLHS
jgi:hypothetical protein